MKTLFSCFLAAALLSAGVAAAQTIDEIQYYNPITGAPESPWAGLQVTVSGTVFVVPVTYNPGTHYVQDATGGIQFYYSGAADILHPQLQIGDTIELTGTVGSNSGEIQIANPTWVITGFVGEPTPIETTPDGILGAAEPYEWVGNFVAVTGMVVARDVTPPVFTWFEMTNVGGGLYTLFEYVDTDTGIDISGMLVGDDYKVLGPIVNFNGTIEQKPRKATDLIDDPTLPVVIDVELDDWSPMENQSVSVAVELTDDVGIFSASVTYRTNNTDGTAPGAWNTVNMIQTRSETWAGTVPGQVSDRVDFYVTVTDDEQQSVTSPANAPDGFFQYAVGLTSIYEMQYVHPDSVNHDNNYVDKVLNLRGVVTVGTDDAPFTTQFIIQEQEVSPDWGDYRWGGVMVRESNAAETYLRGDIVEVGGFGDEYQLMSQIQTHSPNAIELVGIGAELPAPMRVNTRDLADGSLEDGNGRIGEGYEAVWVKTWASEVLDILTYTFIISDTGARPDSLDVEPTQELTYVPTIGDVILVEGYMENAFGQYQLRPIGDEYVTAGITAVPDDVPTVVEAGGFKSVHPNPFNPATKLEFAVNRENLTQLNIYNLRGELVRSLVNERLPVGDYVMTWDGTDLTGRGVPSGNYFARLRIGASVMQVRKLSLVK